MAACHFDTQPLFEPPGADDAKATGTVDLPGTGSGASDAGPAGLLDAALSSHFADAAQDSVGRSGVAPTCQRGEALGCDEPQLLICGAADAAMTRVSCGDAGCNAAAKRCNECRPGMQACRDDQLVQCDAEGRVGSARPCPMGCVSATPGVAACRVCAAGAAECRDGASLRCAPDGLSWQTTPCEQGCDEATRACRGRLVPANLPSDACAWTDLVERERTLEGEVDLDVDRECPHVIAQGPDQPSLCVYAFERLRLAEGARLRATGSRALVLLATVSMEIEGRLSVSAQAVESGPGSLDVGSGVGKDATGRVAEGTQVGMWTNLPANAGGGGGGYATSGSAGGDGPGQCGSNGRCAEGGLGGELYGTDNLVPLLGGSMGGRNSAAIWSTRRGDPGGGGGALQLVACDTLRLGSSAVIDANGGGGEGGFPGSSEMDSETPGAGAGGGSGGAILLQTRALEVQPGALLVANGGGGGGGATRTADEPEPHQPGQPGQDGQLSAVPAAGGVGAGDSHPGGAGGAIDPPVAGTRTRQRTQAAGGGGGAAGKIHIETAVPLGPMAGVLMSPRPTYGTVTVE